MCLTETEIEQNQPVKTAKGHMGRLRNTTAATAVNG